MAKFLGGNGRGGPGWGAAFEWSIYWRFIPELIYIKPEFLMFTKAMTLLLNIWNFFVNLNGFSRCW